MGVRIKDLRPAAQPIAEKIRNWGFTMTDILSIGLMFLGDKDANEIAALRGKINNLPQKKTIAKKSKKSLQDTIDLIKEMLEVEKQQPGTIYRVLSIEQRKIMDDFIKAVGPSPKQRKRAKKA